MNIGNEMKYLRTAELISQEKIAEVLGIKRSTYKEYELQYAIIPILHLNTFCNYFNISIDYILKLSKRESYNNNKVDIDLTITSKRLRELRKEKNLTQSELGNFLKIDNSTISKYEKGKNLISTPLLYSLCKEYKISADYLLGKTDEPKYLK